MRRGELPYILKRNNLIGVEIGVEQGFFSESLLKTGLFSKFFSVDPWAPKIPGVFREDEQFMSHNSEETFSEASKRLEKYSQCVVLRKTSEEASQMFPEESLDFVFLDGDHTLKGVTIDLECWFSKVKKGGMIAGHDYVDYIMNCGDGITSHFAVKTAVDDFFDSKKIEVEVIKEVLEVGLEWIKDYEDFPNWPSWYVIK